MKWRYFDMFSGIGGFPYGFYKAGFNFSRVFYSDIDDYANRVYALRFPSAIPLGNICNVSPSDLGRIDIVSAGFPCQDLSVAGRKEGIHGKRSGLFDEIIRVCRVCRPKYIVLENVANLISRPDWFGYVLGRIAEIGYDAEWEIIRASDVGAPHRRARIWIVAYSRHRGGRDIRAIEKRDRQATGWSTRSNKISRLGKQSEIMADTKNGRSWKTQERNKTRRLGGGGDLENPECDRLEKQRENRISGGQTNTITNSSWWATEPDVGRMAHGIPSRVDRLKCLGNSIVPQIAQYIGERILEIENTP